MLLFNQPFMQHELCSINNVDTVYKLFTFLYLNIKMREKSDLSDFDCGMLLVSDILAFSFFESRIFAHSAP